MNEQQKQWQQDGRRAFDWIASVYTQTSTARADARALFEENEWTVLYRNMWGGDATTTILDEWPFLFLTAFCALPPGLKQTAAEGTAAVMGFFFYDSKREGPQCFAGSVRWSNPEAELDHWMLYYALGGPGSHDKQFERSGDGIRTARPTEEGRRWKPGVEEVKWFEVPLSTITSAERINEVVAAAQSMVRGDEAPAKKILASL